MFRCLNVLCKWLLRKFSDNLKFVVAHIFMGMDKLLIFKQITKISKKSFSSQFLIKKVINVQFRNGIKNEMKTVLP